MDDDHCYRAVQSRDGRFDGAFFTCVTSTGIYCRPSCPAVTPKRANVRFYPTAAAAQDAGFRACKRCRPDAAPGSPEWNLRADAVGRAMRLIADGEVERLGVSGLARRLHYSPRHVHRLMRTEVGAGPLALARAYRIQSARTLLETTDLPITDVAFAAGFASVRQFNDTLRTTFALTPTDLRRRAGRPGPSGRKPNGVEQASLEVHLAYRQPHDLDGALTYLAARAVPGVESFAAGIYRRVLRLPHGLATVALSADRNRPAVRCRLRLDDVRDLTAAVQRCRRLLDLDADPVAVDEVLRGDPRIGPSIAIHPGRRVPGAVDGDEIVIRAVLGQQVSLTGARTVAGRLVVAHGTPLAVPDGELTHAFPTAEQLAAVDPAKWPVPSSRQRALSAVANALACGELSVDPGADRDQAEAVLLSLPGIGPWTAAYVRMRALADPDAFLPTDLGVRRAFGSPALALGATERWRPWRAYGLQHLWTMPKKGVVTDAAVA